MLLSQGPGDPQEAKLCETALLVRTRFFDCVPIVQRLTFLSSPPVTSTPDDLRPMWTQLTFPAWAKNSSAACERQAITTRHEKTGSLLSCSRHSLSPWRRRHG